MAFYTNPMGGSSVGNTATVERMRITANGAVGINTTAPGYQLDTKGFGRISTTTFTGTGLNDGATGSGTYTGTDTSIGSVARLVGIEGGVVSGVFNLESSGVEAPDWRPRHDKQYHEA